MKELVLVYKGITYPSYRVAEDGTIRSIDRVSDGRFKKGQVLTPRDLKGKSAVVGNYYQRVSIFNGSKKSRVDGMIHRMVAETFIENPEDKPTVNHKDGVRDNNCVSNLEWATRSELLRHAYDERGRKTPRGEKHRLSKLTEEVVAEIYLNHLKGRERKEFNANGLGKQYGVDGRAILNIYRKEAWAWLTDKLDK